MASVVTICNLALAGLGDEATVSSIDPPEGSAQAEHCKQWYPVARDIALESHPGGWNFATTRAALNLLAEGPINGWQYKYSLPSDFVRALAVLEDTESAKDPQPYEIETQTDNSLVLYSDTADAVLKYTRRVTDPVKFSPLFTDAVVLLLRSFLAGPVLKGDAGIKAARTWFDAYTLRIADARGVDANQRKVEPTHTPTWIANR